MIRAAASTQALGVYDRLGTLEAGKLACRREHHARRPAADIRSTESVFLVMKEGNIYKNDTAIANPPLKGDAYEQPP